ncbi:dihydropteroate synthase [Ruania halotolerans]|uniref:dihydropteroate synthase n=1 Tax=Ruania halotolerans TaxID=2897773 RepID=UPI001E55942C|nr:dihydropteroate synthase [Ruania halotolerans]UFU07391.1 dihydropteroate synthase [Ruania halotolerans]
MAGGVPAADAPLASGATHRPFASPLTPPEVAALAPRRIGAREFDFANRVAVMAIVNRTPDSFYDAGRTYALERAVEAALQAVDAGADWVDIGGMAFSPDAEEVGAAEELDRVLGVIEAVRAVSDVVISVDTQRPEVARACVQAGADVVNDTTGLRVERMAETVAETGASVVIAHSIAQPHRHHRRPQYTDVMAEVGAFLAAQTQVALAAGVPPEQIIIDPGHDLNKNTRHSLELVRRLEEITALGYPTLVALSNKDFVGETLDRDRPDRLWGTLAATVMCIERGARIVRAHEVAATVDAVRMAEAVLGLREPAQMVHNV